MELSPFAFFALILISALLTMAALKIIRAPTLPAYFIVGLFVGPNGIGILHSSETAHFAGEMGIILLLFTIGIKFNLSTLRSIRNYVFVLGSMQVAFTTTAIAIPAWFFFDDFLIASLVGFVAAMSSTAVVSQLLLENNAVASPVGRRAIAVLLLQDLAVIPLIIIYSNKSGEYSLILTILLLVGKIAVVLLLVLFIAPKIMRHWLNWISRYGDKELFIVNIIAIISLFSLLTGVFGLSYVLGAFLAGILISETFHRHRVEQIIDPFRQLFLGFFFITLGILIDPSLLAENAGMIALLTAILLVIKFPVVYICTRLAKAHQVTACRTAFLLGGTGEFGFVLLAVAQQNGIMSDSLFQLLVPVNILAMIIVPLFWQQSEKIIRRLFPEDWRRHDKRLKKGALKAQHLDDHLIICGFGRTGQAIVAILRTIGARDFIAVEEDYIILDSVGNAEQVIYGSSDSSDSLLSAGILRARALVVTYTEPVIAALSVQKARQLNSSLYIIAKATTAQQAQALHSAGADEVLVEAHEAGFSLAEKSLRHLDNKSLWMLPHALENARSRKNPLFLGQYTGIEPEDGDYMRRFLGFLVTNRNTKLTLKALPATVEVVAWRRNDEEMVLDDKEAYIKFNDQLVLLGDDEGLSEAEKLFSQ